MADNSLIAAVKAAAQRKPSLDDLWAQKISFLRGQTGASPAEIEAALADDPGYMAWREVLRLTAERDAALAQVAEQKAVLSEIFEWSHRQFGLYPDWHDRLRKVLGQFDGDAGLPGRDAQMRAEGLSKIETILRGLISGQFGSLSLDFNGDHACNYSEAKDWDDYGAGNTDSRIDWVSEDERAKAVANNTVWTLQWYPNTPVSFCCIGASSLSAILAAAEKDAPHG